MTIDREPEFGSLFEEVEAAAESALNPVVSAGEDAASALIDIFDGGDGGASGGGESGGGGSTDPWDPTPEIPPELEAIIDPVVDRDEAWRIN